MRAGTLLLVVSPKQRRKFGEPAEFENLQVLIGTTGSVDYFGCNLPEKIHSRRVYVAVCIADCLDLDFQPTGNCSFDSRTGQLDVKYENKDGCPKCSLDWKNLQSYKIGASLVPLRTHRVCGKKINFGHIVFGTEYDRASMFCGFIYPLERQWLPRNWDEVRCVIEALPEDIQRLGKLRVMVYKSNCSADFFFCATDTPRSLRNSFLFAELEKSETNFPDGTCAIFDFKIQRKKAVDVQLRVTDCKEKAFAVCERDA